jgi:hypothetical protein
MMKKLTFLFFLAGTGFLLSVSLAQAKELFLECGPGKMSIELNFENATATGFGVSGSFQTRGTSGEYHDYSIDGPFSTTAGTVTMELDFKSTVSLADMGAGRHATIQTSLFRCQDDGWQSGCSPISGGSFDCAAIHTDK